MYLKIGAINLTVHPHSEEIYINLLTEVFNLKRFAKVRGDRYGMIARINKENDGSLLYGEFATFINMDKDSDWIDISSGEIKSPDQLSNEITLPPHLRPGSKRFPFLFFGSKHILTYQVRNERGEELSPRLAEKMLKGLFSAEVIQEKFGPVEITVIPEEESLERIFRMELRKLRIVITPPNPDGNEEAEREILERLGNMNAKRFEETYTSLPGRSLEPDPKTKTLAEVAAHNGFVEGEGIDHGIKAQESTRSHPKIQRVDVKKDESPSQRFRQVAESIVNALRRS